MAIPNGAMGWSALCDFGNFLMILTYFFIRINHRIETKLTYQNKLDRYRHKHFTSEFPIVIDKSCNTVHHCQTYTGGDESCVVNLTS